MDFFYEFNSGDLLDAQYWWKWFWKYL